ncbi:unnamed protein product [Brassicogethes aeneus]|uniref:Uncharacterized protein n=1 Tax=Brassicogethes aeneus TaxID=1431903 RepID=A0A9P0FEJ7_BRAAE|nr:unnamed protein product [Brassicogethes aeneus]
MQNRLPMQDKFFNQLVFITPKIALALERPEECQQLLEVTSKFQPIIDKENEIATEWRNIQFHFSDEEKVELLELPISKFWHKIRETKDFNNKTERLEEVKELKAQSSTKSTEVLPETLVEDIIAEISAREKKRKNIILFNVPEPVGNNNTERLAQDKQTAVDLISHISSETRIENQPFRLERLTFL